LRSDTAATPATRIEASQGRSHDLAERRPPVPQRIPLPLRWMRRALSTLLAIALIAGVCWHSIGSRMMSTDDTIIEAEKLGISTEVSGVVEEVDVTENQHVEAGQVLYRLDDRPFRLALKQAEAEIGTVRIDLVALKASYQYLQVLVSQAKHDVNNYLAELHRERSLPNEEASSQTTLDAVRGKLQNARQELASLDRQLTAITIKLGGDADIPFAQHPRYLDALAQFEAAARQLAHTVVRAPFAGSVASVSSIAPGKYLAASTPALYLIATDRVLVDAKP
jgi:membrane fusion protein (multidrug efflux system)